MEVLLLKEFIKYFIFIQLIGQCCCIDKCDLRLSHPYWENDWQVFIQVHENGRYELLRSRHVPVKKTIYGVCGNKDLQSHTCIGHRLFDRPPFLEKLCGIDESLEPVRIKSNVSYCPYTLYKFGFNTKIREKFHFLEAYQVCFDLVHMRPLFTINTAYSAAGVAHNSLKFNFDGIFDNFLFDSFVRGVQRERVKSLLGPSQTYIKESDTYNFVSRGQLTPMGDFSMNNLKRTTFDMLNVIPRFPQIHSGNWKRIEKWVRNPARASSKICTGVLDCDLDSKNIKDLHCVLQLKNSREQPVPIFLADNRRIPVPLWTYKIVKSAEISLVFLTLNNIYHEGAVPVSRLLCKEFKCPLELLAGFRYGRTYCCDYRHFMAEMKHLKDVC